MRRKYSSFKDSSCRSSYSPSFRVRLELLQDAPLFENSSLLSASGPQSFYFGRPEARVLTVHPLLVPFLILRQWMKIDFLVLACTTPTWKTIFIWCMRLHLEDLSFSCLNLYIFDGEVFQILSNKSE